MRRENWWRFVESIGGDVIIVFEHRVYGPEESRVVVLRVTAEDSEGLKQDFYRVRACTTFGEILERWCELAKVPAGDARLLWRGRELRSAETPLGLGMKPLGLWAGEEYVEINVEPRKREGERKEEKAPSRAACACTSPQQCPLAHGHCSTWLPAALQRSAAESRRRGGASAAEPRKGEGERKEEEEGGSQPGEMEEGLPGLTPLAIFVYKRFLCVLLCGHLAVLPLGSLALAALCHPPAWSNSGRRH